jgi:hypothetical protein
MHDPVTQFKFLHEHKLATWSPSGVLNFGVASMIIDAVSFHERTLDEEFHRFIDWSKLTDVRLNFVEVEHIATLRRLAYSDGPSVKSAFFAPNSVAFGIARMFATLMEPSPIDVRVFREIELAAAWLEVPVAVLQQG